MHADRALPTVPIRGEARMNRRGFLVAAAASTVFSPAILTRRGEASGNGSRVRYFTAPAGSRSRDVACSLGEPYVWFCGQGNGTLNRLDPRDGAIREVRLGEGAAPHGVVFGP